MTSNPSCKLVQCGLFQETAWAITHAVYPEVDGFESYKGNEYHPSLNEDTWEFELYPNPDGICYWDDLIQEFVVYP